MCVCIYIYKCVSLSDLNIFSSFFERGQGINIKKIYFFPSSSSIEGEAKRKKKKRTCLDTEMIRSDYMMIVCKLIFYSAVAMTMR